MTKVEKQAELDRLRIVADEMTEHVQDRRQELILWLSRLAHRALDLGAATMEGKPIERRELDETYRMAGQKFQDVKTVEEVQKDVDDKIAQAVIELADDELWKGEVVKR